MQVLDKVDVLETYKEIVYDSPNMTIYAPAVVRLKKFSRFEPMKLRFSRANVYARDKKICQYCGNKFQLRQLTLDHVIPKSMGGDNSWTNIVTACRGCNAKKADRTPQQAKMKLLNRPQYPNARSIYRNQLGENLPIEWQNWIFD
jgi:5-methylcytosine-specific restriction endonuclease McrA